MCPHIQVRVCARVCVCLQRKWGIEVRGSADLLWEIPVRLLMSSNHHLTLIPPPHCLVQIDLYDPVGLCGCVCVWVCVCACMHLLPPHQSTAALLLIALHSAHLSTCLLVLVISLPPPSQQAGAHHDYFPMEMREALWVGRSGEMRWGNKEVRKWGDGRRKREIPWWVLLSILRITARSTSTSAAEGSAAEVHISAFQNEISNTGKKTDASFYKMIVAYK